MAHKPNRTCLGCMQVKEKHELIRIVKNKNGDILIDLEYKKQGRGAYVCKNSSCIDNLKKNKRLNKAFKQNIDDKIYVDLYNIID